MPRATFRFYAELIDLLPKDKRKRNHEIDVRGNPSVGDVIADFRIAHTMVDLVLANDRPVDFQCPVRDGDRISVYPVFECLNITEITRLRKIPLRKPAFIADKGLEKLVRYLRLLGLDVLFDETAGREELITISRRERRIILTKSAPLLKTKGVTHGLLVPAETPIDQVRHVIDFLDIADRVRPFTRCLYCNATVGNTRPCIEILKSSVQYPTCGHRFRRSAADIHDLQPTMDRIPHRMGNSAILSKS